METDGRLVMRTRLNAKGTTTIISAFLCLAALSLSSCTGGRTAGEHIADMPHWMGGLREMHRLAAARRNMMHGWLSEPKKRRGLRLSSSSLSSRYLSCAPVGFEACP